MTVVVAALTADGVTIVADSQISDIYSKLNGYPNKVWVDVDLGYAFGSCGDVRTSQIARFAVDWPRYRQDEHDLFKFAVLDVVSALKSGLENHGALKEKNGFQTMESEFIIAIEDEFFVIGAGFEVYLPVNGRVAIGNGYAEAYGALGDIGIWDIDEVIEAARRSSLTAQGVGGDLYYTTTKDLVIERVENVQN